MTRAGGVDLKRYITGVHWPSAAYLGHGTDLEVVCDDSAEGGVPLIRLSENLGNRLVSDFNGAKRATAFRKEDIAWAPSFVVILQYMGILS